MLDQTKSMIPLFVGKNIVVDVNIFSTVNLAEFSVFPIMNCILSYIIVKC